MFGLLGRLRFTQEPQTRRSWVKLHRTHVSRAPPEHQFFAGDPCRDELNPLPVAEIVPTRHDPVGPGFGGQRPQEPSKARLCDPPMMPKVRRPIPEVSYPGHHHGFAGKPRL